VTTEQYLVRLQNTPQTLKFKVRNVKPSDESIKSLRIEERNKYILYFDDHKKVFQNIAVDAATKALMKKAKKLKDCDRPLQKSKRLLVDYQSSENSNLKMSKN